MFAACEKETPFDTQSPDDAPLILKPYNESGTGSFSYDLANPDTPLHDSVTVTPSDYTTVNWYLDGQRVFTGTKIEMTFPAGKYALTIEAVTAAGKRTERTGSVTVHPYAADPYSEAPAGGRHYAPGKEAVIEGANLDKVTSVVLAKDIFGKEVVSTVAPDAAEAAQLKVTFSAIEDGKYYLRLSDAEGLMYGADAVNIHNGAIALAGFNSFEPGHKWEITGLNMANVASVTVEGTVITDIVATETSVTLTAPQVDLGEYTVSMQNADGSAVLFATAQGTVTEVKATISDEKTLWEGSVTIDWNADLLRLEASAFADVPAGATIYIYYTVPEAEYHALRIVNPDWSSNFLAQVDGMQEKPNPYTFTFDDACKALTNGGNAFCVVGFGINVNKISYK